MRLRPGSWDLGPGPWGAWSLGLVLMDEILRVLVWTAIAIALGTATFYSFWRLRSMLRIWRAPQRPLQSVQAVIWRDPGDVSRLDLAAGPGGADGAPHPPFRFLEEHLSGSQPCISVRDSRGRCWRIKWGGEVHAEALATRLVWAAGYFVETTYYLPEGRIEAVPPALQRSSECLHEDGRFERARFELDEENVIKHFDEHSWAWNDNPFVGTPELNGLKLVMMWLSNWDAKDVRDVARGSNTAVFEHTGADGLREARYLIIDWGGAFGRWGRSVMTRGRWDSEGFAAESESFVVGVDDGFVTLGYTGQRTGDIAGGIAVDDVRWLMRTLGRLSDTQIAAAIRASGGTVAEVATFTRALRSRLEQLRAVAALSSRSVGRPWRRVSAAL